MSIVKRTENGLPLIFDDIFKTDWLGGTTNLNNVGVSIPAVNIKENEDNFLVEVAAPGKAKEDFNVELDNNVLTISSEAKNEKGNNEKEKFTRREFSYTTFKRAFSLPETVNNAHINASYSNGVLLITLPKKEEAKVQPKRLIDIL